MVTTTAEILKELAQKQPNIQRIDDRWGGRYYKVEGSEAKLPSVTTVLNVISKPALVPWAKNMALESVRAALMNYRAIMPTEDDYENWVDTVMSEAKAAPEKARDQAADFGSRLHEVIDKYLKGTGHPVEGEMAIPFRAFQDWLEQSGLTIHQSELMVYSKNYGGYAGTVDAVATRQTDQGEELVVVDWKTSNGIWPEMAFQVAAYAEALSEMLDHRWPVTEAWILRLGKNKPEFEAKRAPISFSGFAGALSLFNGLAEVKKAWK